MRKYDIKQDNNWSFGADISEMFYIAERAGLTNYEIEKIIDMPINEKVGFADIIFERMA